MKPIADDSKIASNDADGVGRYAFSDFMNPPNSSETINCTFHMNDIIKQKTKNLRIFYH